MANEIPIIFKGAITAQASAAIDVDVDGDSAGALTTIDNSLTGNGKGCHFFTCYINVTVAPSGANAVASVKYAGVSSGTSFKFDSGSLSKTIPDGETGEWEMGPMMATAPLSQVKLYVEDADITASLIAVPILPQAQDA